MHRPSGAPPDARPAPLELWLGAECSVVRIGDRHVDQSLATGHAGRLLADIDRMAALGARAVRFPVLWERTWPDPARAPDWTWADAGLSRLRARGIRPIVGLVHHGSGPIHTNLLDESFVEGLAAFAGLVARRYPWVEDYTPVNEPLTTARFSGLYGHWYPHARSDHAFLRALLVQCRATAAAMAEVRRIQPAARLVQTEDMATVSSTPELAYQAMFENERRFLGLDLLCGRVGPAHPLHRYITAAGIDAGELALMSGAPCPPDLIGLNHYVTSDRFLDHRLDRYPPHVRGGNGRHAYADVEAVRVLGPDLPGHAALLAALWSRYGIPLAITEAHLGCAPEEQVRWLRAAWRGAEAARARGVDVRAVTAWSVFGACDWDSLLTRGHGHYEPGVFDVRGGVVRPTALAGVARELAQSGTSTHPALDAPGWWRRDGRHEYPPYGPVARVSPTPRPRLILVTGARGTLGTAIARICESRGLRTVLAARRDLDIGDRDAVADMLDAHRPWAVVNAAGFVRVDDAEAARQDCLRTNASAPCVLADACGERGVRLAVFSSDLVFDGAKGRPYVESDPVSPLGAYGESKAVLEREVAARCPGALVVRTSAFFGPWDQANFLFALLDALRRRRPFRAPSDVVVSPTYVPHLADAVITLLVDGADGVWHLANGGALSWHAFATRVAGLAGVDASTLEPCTVAELGLPAPRPRCSALASERGALMPPLYAAMECYVAACRAAAGSEVGRRRA